MPNKPILPDKPTIVIDAATIDQMPPDIQEALGQFYTEQERAKAKAKDAAERAYQSQQADALMALDDWQEVDISPDEQSLMEEVALDDSLSRLKSSEGSFVAVELEMESQRPTLHQFYRDLYGVGIDGSLLATVAKIEVDGINTGAECVLYFDKAIADGAEGFAVNSRLPSPILVNHRDRQHPYQQYEDYFEFVNGVERETSFIHMGSFWVPPNGFLTAKRNAMTSINGFCVDLDRVDDDKGRHYDADWVMKTLVDCLKEHPQVMPNYLMLSGTGIQLWYVFGRPIPLLSSKGGKGRKPSPRRMKYGDLLKKLYQFFKRELPPNRFKVDTACAAINHAFRAPNSPTKHHYPTRLFALNGRKRTFIDPLTLSDFLGGDLKPYDVEDWNQEAYERLRKDSKDGHDRWFESPATEKQVAWLEKLEKMGCIEEGTSFRDMTKAEADAAIKSAEIVFTARAHYAVTGGYVVLSNGYRKRLMPRNKGLYLTTLHRIEEETPTGSRYWALFVLAGIGYNCNIPEHVVLDDMRRLKDSAWGRKHSKDGKPINDADIRSAIKGYNPLGALRHRAVAEDFLCWKYNPPQRRNGRTRREHLWGDWVNDKGTPVVNTARENRRLASAKSRLAASESKRKKSLDALVEYLQSNPSASKRECCRELSMSATTVTKYWFEACAMAGIKDCRTGNHSPLT